MVLVKNTSKIFFVAGTFGVTRGWRHGIGTGKKKHWFIEGRHTTPDFFIRGGGLGGVRGRLSRDATRNSKFRAELGLRGSP